MTVFGSTSTGEFLIGIDTELIIVSELLKLVNVSDRVNEYFRLVVNQLNFGFAIGLNVNKKLRHNCG